MTKMSYLLFNVYKNFASRRFYVYMTRMSCLLFIVESPHLEDFEMHILKRFLKLTLIIEMNNEI